jgi:hypothetical protein
LLTVIVVGEVREPPSRITNHCVIASTTPDPQDAYKRNLFQYNGALYEALAVMAGGPMVLRTRLRAWFRRWRMYDW